jgi:hypothetical protein
LRRLRLNEAVLRRWFQITATVQDAESRPFLMCSGKPIRIPVIEEINPLVMQGL